MMNVGLQSVYLSSDHLPLVLFFGVPSIIEYLIDLALEGVYQLVLLCEVSRLVVNLLQESVGIFHNIDNGVF